MFGVTIFKNCENWKGIEEKGVDFGANTIVGGETWEYLEKSRGIKYKARGT
jgi:hypothetical protein